MKTFSPLLFAGSFFVVTLLPGATMELTRPGDYIVAVDLDLANPDSLAGNNTNFPITPNFEGPRNAIDNTNAKYLNFGGTNSGFIVQPNSRIGLLNGIQFTTANDTPARDPLTYTLEGTNNGGLSYVPISSGPTGIVAGGGTPRNTAVTTIPLTNSDYYAAYRVVFPTLDGGPLMQIAEVNLFGDDGSFRDVIPGFNISGITPVGTYNPGGGGSEGVANLLDGNTATKLFDGNDPGGFTYNINVNAPSVVNGLRLATGNDSGTAGQNRNPASITLRGTMDGSTFTDILTDALSPNYNINTFFYDFAFNNNTRYNSYQLFIPSVQGGGGGLQLSELQLFGLIPEPSRAVLMMAGLVGVLARRRRRL